MSTAVIKAIVTGHTHGLGEAIAADLLGRAIAVLGLARTESVSLARRYPALLRQTPLDLSDSAALAAWLGCQDLRDFAAGAATLLLINNAGTLQPVGPLQDQDPLALAQAVSLNVAAPLMLAAGLARLAGSAVQLRILHVSSGAARRAYAGWSVYCASKAALDHHARAVALDGRQGVRICSLAPGVIDTAMQGQIRATPAAQFPARERFVGLHRDGGLSTPAQAAAHVVEYVLGEAFGGKPVDDVRGLGQGQGQG